MNGASPHDNKANSDFGNDPSAAVGVRIHQTEMQRYLNGLMNSQGDQLPNVNSKLEMLRHLKNSLGEVDDARHGRSDAEKPFLKGDNGGNGGGSSGNNNGGGGGGSGSLSMLNQNRPPSDADGANGKAGSSSRQKNDKAVEVHHDQRIIARFRTQTECARYLRATPEAVSYHCSKGGGICNGLVIKPLGGAEVARLMEMSSQGQQPQSDPNVPSGGPQFGLFEGAVLLRPKERPQLKPETVAILKDWLLSPDHMDNPYPNQRESEMLMERTGLDKTQLKHWFNNARKRILKPLLKNGGKKAPVPPKKRDQASGRGAGGGPRKKRRIDGSGGVSPLTAAAGLGPDAGLCGTVGSASASSDGTNKMSNTSTRTERQKVDEMRIFEQRQQQLLMEERQRIRPRQFDDPFLDGRGGFGRGDSNDSGNLNDNNNNMNMNMMNNMMSMNQYDRMLAMGLGMNGNSMPGIGRGDMGGMRGDMGGMRGDMMRGDMGGMRGDIGGMRGDMGGMRGDIGGMMGVGDSMRGMMNNDTPRNSFNDNFGSSSMGGGGGFQGRGNNSMGSGFNGCMEVNDDRFNDYPPSRMNFNNGGRFPQDRFNSDFNQDAYGDDEGGADGRYCQPLGPQGGGNPSEPRDPSTSVPSGDDSSARSNAVFKQQVATMAMNEASAAFKDMEDAFAHAKGVLAAARTGRTRMPGGGGDPEDDPMVIEANARAKKCQGVAMFKLKVSQRASEEAANAYDSYQRMVEEMGGIGAGDVGGGAERGMMMMPGDDGPFS